MHNCTLYGGVQSDALHKLTTSLVRAHGCIVIEDLNVKGIMQGRKLSRAISGMGLGGFRRQPGHKTQPSLTTVMVADRWFASSKRFVRYDMPHETLTLKDRTPRCNGCDLLCKAPRVACLGPHLTQRLALTRIAGMAAKRG